MSTNKQLTEDIYKIGLEFNDPLSIEQIEDLYEKNKKASIKRTELVYILNILENARFCSIKNENNTIITKMRPQETVRKLIKLSDIDFLIYTKVENSHNNGIWTADLRKQTKLLIHQVQKGLKLLCEQKLIKQVNNIHVKNRKMYILYDLEASEKVIGGSFYIDGEFDEKILTYIQDNICFYLNNNNYSPVSSVIKYIKQLGERMNYYSESDIQLVIDTLLYEDKITICKNNFNEDAIYLYNSYDRRRTVISNSEYMKTNNSNNINNSNDNSQANVVQIGVRDLEDVLNIPCFSCNLFNKCNSDINTNINPSVCNYLSKFLELDLRRNSI